MVLVGLQQFVIETFEMQESLAHREVTNAGYDCTWLKEQKEYRTKHGRRLVTVSFLPSYLFVALDIVHDNWRRIIGLRGVKQILGSTPEKPKALPAGDLDEIIARLAASDTAGVEPKDGPKPIRKHLKTDDTVFIDMGAQRPLVAKFLRMTPKERARVLMEYMGGEREAEFDMARVTLAPGQLT